ncbi:MAG: integrin alpha [Candidatus Gracilibacteria bacterium]
MKFSYKLFLIPFVIFCLTVVLFVKFDFSGSATIKISPSTTITPPAIRKLNSIKLSASVVDFTASDGTIVSAMRITGPSDDVYFGSRIAEAGDVNGDGYKDILISAPYNDLIASDAGLVYLIYGPINESTTEIESVQFSINQSEYNLGIYISPAGDLNSDGFDDIFISGGSSAEGDSVYLIYGKSDLSSMLVSNSNVAKFNPFTTGMSGAPLGDINLDGYDDVLIYSSDHHASYYVLSGSNTALKGVIEDSDSHLTAYELSDTSINFSRIALENDINGDAISDLIIGNPEDNNLFISLGLAPWEEVSSFSCINTESIGNSLDSSHDFNNDGINDIIAGDYESFSRAGQLVFIPGDLDSSFDCDSYHISGAEEYGELGTSVAYLDDWNGDAYPEILAGASGESDDTGTLYFLYGEDGLDFNGRIEDRYDLLISGENPDNYFGENIESFEDGFLVSAKGFGDSGAVYVFY